MKEFLIPFAQCNVDGAVVLLTPFEARPGRDYMCPECNGHVVFRREGRDATGSVVRDQHFAHAPSAEGGCGGGTGESFIHRAAKQRVKQAVQEWTNEGVHQPLMRQVCRCGRHRERLVEAGDPVLEYRGIADGQCIPDVFVAGASPLIIEVRYKHPIDDAKIAAYAGHCWAEIDAASVLAGDKTWVTWRASWAMGCRECERRAQAEALTPEQADEANRNWCARATAPKGGYVIHEPANNLYGRFKVLRRVDGFFIVHDPEEWPPNAPVFHEEAKARTYAQRRSEPAT
jgi:uncharacterized protein YlaI